ncbi:hypothetical protein K439DRAFT_1643100 [Ramaria rubella]|nr:hypothetical protein K439DRAFT_1643100 [Ramaria rubella]
MSSHRIFSFNRSNHTHQSSQQYPRPYRDKLLAACLKMQSKSPNLVFYDHVQGAVAEYPYPMSAARLISLAGISKYNECRRQAFECWCGLLSPETPTFLRLQNMKEQGAFAFCAECGLNVSLDEKYQTATMAADYPPFEEYGATMPATLPSNAAVQNPMRSSLGRSKGTRQCSTVGYSVSNPKNLLTLPATPLSSPPALTDLLGSIGRRGKGRSLTCFLSLVLLSSSVVSGLISGPNSSSTSQSSGSSCNDSEKLELCDRCFAAYPLEEFKTHTCRG